MRTLLASALALLVLCPVAQAYEPGADMEAAHAVAVQHWGGEPCGGQVAVTWGHPGDGINAHSSWFGIQGQPATYIDCAVVFSYDVTWDWPKLCTVYEHEYGHLFGHEHDASVLMNAYYVGPTPECSGEPVRAAQSPSAQPDTAPRASKAPKPLKRRKRALRPRRVRMTAWGHPMHFHCKV